MKKYRDEIAEVSHEIVKDGYSLGIVTDDEINEFEADCFVSEPEKTPEAPKTVVTGHVEMKLPSVP
jgi:hypothetical protein